MMKLIAIISFSLCLLFSCSNDTTSDRMQDQTTNPGANASQENSTAPSAANTETKRIVFFGNSLSAGYGVDPEDGFVGIIRQRIDSLGLPYEVINAGKSGETTAGGKSRISWVLQQPLDILVLELGGNDGLRGLDPASSYENLQSIIDQTKDAYPKAKIVIAGMEAPPNMGNEFTGEFRAIFPQLAQENKAALIPFLLEDVGGIPSLNLPDGIHPNPKGHRIVAQNIWEVLEPLLKEEI